VLSASPIFESDYNEGVLTQLSAAGVPMSALALGKIGVAWVTQGGALALISGVLALQYRLPPQEIGFLVLSLAVGSGVLVHFSALFGSMTLMARQSSMLVYLLAMPLFVPVLVFGTSVLNSVQMGQDPVWPLAVLAGLSVLCVLSVPLLVGQLLIWAME
jgi:heme exporter protein B